MPRYTKGIPAKRMRRILDAMTEAQQRAIDKENRVRRFTDGQLVRDTSATSDSFNTGWILRGLVDTGPHAAGLLLYEIEPRDGTSRLFYREPGELAPVLRNGKPIVRPDHRWHLDAKGRMVPKRHYKDEIEREEA